MASASSTDASPPPSAPRATTTEPSDGRAPNAFDSVAFVQHIGTWLLIALVARLGLHDVAAHVGRRRVDRDALRVALDAVIAALAIGDRRPLRFRSQE